MHHRFAAAQVCVAPLGSHRAVLQLFWQPGACQACSLAKAPMILLQTILAGLDSPGLLTLPAKPLLQALQVTHIW